MENLVKLNIKGISYSQTQTGAYALILEENWAKENYLLSSVDLKHSRLHWP